MKKGEFVLVPFPFTDLPSMKNRPALVLLDNDEDATLSFITTQKRWAKEWDIYLEPTDQNGLKKPSIVRLAKIRTLLAQVCNSCQWPNSNQVSSSFKMAPKEYECRDRR